MMTAAADASPPLDFSFRNLTSVGDLDGTKPRRGVKRYRKSASGLYDCHAIRLNNNQLMSIHGIHATLYQVWISTGFRVKHITGHLISPNQIQKIKKQAKMTLYYWIGMKK
jgi:hypothetical protein